MCNDRDGAPRRLYNRRSAETARCAVSVWLATCAWLLAACLPVTRPVIKLGLIAPFEGRYRDVGYEVIYAARLAVREANGRGGVAGHALELVALDDGGDPALAVEQAQKLATDPQVVAVLGHWLDGTTEAAAPAYAVAGLPMLATTAGPLPPGVWRFWVTEAATDTALPAGSVRCPLPCGWLEGAAWLKSVSGDEPVAGPALWAFPQFATLSGSGTEGAFVVLPSPLPAQSNDTGFAERYRAISNGVEPRAYAVLAYDAMNLLLSAIEAAETPTRVELAAALREVQSTGLSGPIQFNEAGEWVAARAWVYRWRGGALVPAP